MMIILHTASAVIDALDGTSAVAELTGKDQRAVSNWRRRRLPAETYLILIHNLHLRGKIAPAHLWGMFVPNADTVICPCRVPYTLIESPDAVTDESPVHSSTVNLESPHA